jgi:TrmH family RNA methyltransferase
VGAAIRSADALGATGVLALDGTAHPGGWKALRGAMGSTFRIPVGTGRLDEAVSLARRHRIRVAATVAAGGVPLDDAPLAAPLLLLLGNEGAGLPAAAVAAADLRLTIPMRPGVNSLNVGIAAAVLLWSLRARHGRPGGEAAR